MASIQIGLYDRALRILIGYEKITHEMLQELSFRNIGSNTAVIKMLYVLSTLGTKPSMWYVITVSGCCDQDCSLELGRERQRGTLKIVLGINAVMFVVIVAAALYSASSALLSDSLDNLGDALTYGLSLYAVSRGAKVKAKVALFKGGLIFLAATAVVAQIVYKLLWPIVPGFEAMGIFSLLGLAANGVCLYLLWRHRQDDVNMSSVWECSRNDIASNLSVFVAAGAVWLTGKGWPDILVASCLVLLLMRSAIRVISSGLKELRAQG